MAITSQQWFHLPTIYNGKQQWQKHHWLNPDPWFQKHQSHNKRLYLKKTRHKAIEILIEQEPSFKPNPKFKTKKCWLGEMKTVSSSTSRRLFYKLPLRSFRKNHWSTGQQIDRANSGFCDKFFLVWQKYQIKGPKVGGMTILKLPEKRWRSLWEAEGIN